MIEQVIFEADKKRRNCLEIFKACCVERKVRRYLRFIFNFSATVLTSAPLSPLSFSCYKRLKKNRRIIVNCIQAEDISLDPKHPKI